MSVPKQVAIYGLLDPHSGEVRYIGQTSGPLALRLKAHIGQIIAARRAGIPGERSAKALWLRALLEADVLPGIVCLACVDEAQADQVEQDYIAAYRTRGHLLNGAHSPRYGRDSRVR